jgi:hypothetical protein
VILFVIKRLWAGRLVGEEVSHSSDVLFNNATRNDIPGETCSLSDVIDCTRYSSLNKLIVTTGYVIRFLNNLRKRTKNHGNLITENVLTADDMQNMQTSQGYIFRVLQHFVTKFCNFTNFNKFFTGIYFCFA